MTLYQDGINFSALIVTAEQTVIANDRSSYRPFMEIIERHISQTECVITGTNCNRLLMGEPMSKDSFSYEVYTESPDDWCSELATELQTANAPFVEKITDETTNDSKFVLILKRSRDQSSIVCNGRTLVSADRFYEFKGISIIKHFSQRRLRGVFTDFILNCAPEHYQMINLIRKIYNPFMLNELGKNWLMLKQLSKNIKGIENENNSTISGGDDNIIDLISTSLSKIATSDDHLAIIGDYAVNNVSGFKRLQFVCSDPESLFQRLKGEHLKLSLELFLQPNTLAFEPSYRKYSLHHDGKSIIDFINLTEYEAVPVKQSIKGAFATHLKCTEIVSLRIKLIEYWIMSMLAKKNPSFERLVSVLITQIYSIWNTISEMDSISLILTKHYIGRFIDPRVFKPFSFSKTEYLIEHKK